MDPIQITCFLLVLFVGTHFVTATTPYSGINSVPEAYELPKLPYGYDDLEPFIDSATVKVHHTGHHAAYTKKMNDALKKWREESAASDLAKTSILNLLKNINEIPNKYQTAIKNNGGGFVNHAIYWAVMSPNPNRETRRPTGKLLKDINKSFGSVRELMEMFTDTGTKLFGSGYVWLCRIPDETDIPLVVTTSVNQDSPISESLSPILVLDVWEHAYYLKHKNLRPKHIADWWNLVDWQAVEALDNWWMDGAKSHDEL